MTAYIDTKYIGECETCRHHINGKCDTWCDHGECYRPNMSKIPTADVVEVPESGIGDLSDGYHTFNELYHHRAILFSVICNLFPNKAWKSKLHDTGDMYEGMFIVGIETPKGQATYHYDLEPYWDIFKVKELDKAPKWDGHTPEEAIERIATLSTADVVEVKHGEWLEIDDEILIQNVKHLKCSECGVWRFGSQKSSYCSRCGAKMDGGTNENTQSS